MDQTNPQFVGKEPRLFHSDTEKSSYIRARLITDTQSVYHMCSSSHFVFISGQHCIYSYGHLNWTLVRATSSLGGDRRTKKPPQDKAAHYRDLRGALRPHKVVRRDTQSPNTVTCRHICTRFECNWPCWWGFFFGTPTCLCQLPKFVWWRTCQCQCQWWMNLMRACLSTADILFIWCSHPASSSFSLD